MRRIEGAFGESERRDKVDELESKTRCRIAVTFLLF